MARVRLSPRRREESEPQRGLELTCMSNLLSATEERVYFKDLQSRFLLVSAGWIAAYAPGRAAEELIGKTDFDVFSVHDASAAFQDEQQVIRTGEPVVGKVEIETYGGRADTWVSTTKMPLRDEHGRIIGTFGISRDVTAQIRAEDTLAKQALQLKAQNESLRELDRLKDEFIGLVSHELRTPLTSIIGYVEMLREEGMSGPNADHFAEVIERNAQAPPAPRRGPAIPVPDPVGKDGAGVPPRRPGRHRGLRGGRVAARGTAQAHRPGALRHRPSLPRRRPDAHRPDWTTSCPMP